MSRFCLFHKTLCQESCLKRYDMIELFNEEKQEISTKNVEVSYEEKLNHDDLQLTKRTDQKPKKNFENLSLSIYNNRDSQHLRQKSKHSNVTESRRSLSLNIFNPNDNAFTDTLTQDNHVCNTDDSIEFDNTGVTEKKIRQLTTYRCRQFIKNKLKVGRDFKMGNVSDKTLQKCATPSFDTASCTSMTNLLQSTVPFPAYSQCSDRANEQLLQRTSSASTIFPNDISLMTHESSVCGKCPLEQKPRISSSLHSLNKDVTGYLKEKAITDISITPQVVPPVMSFLKQTNNSSSQSTTGAIVLQQTGFSSVSNPFWKHVEGKMDFLEELYTKIQDLTTNELLLQASDIYVRCLDEIDEILRIGSLYALCLILPKGYLDNDKSELIYQENIEMPSNLKLLIHSRHNDKGVDANQPGTCSILMDKHVLVKMNFENCLSNPSKTGTTNSNRDACGHKIVSTAEASKDSTRTFLNNLWNTQTPSHLTSQILKEPVLLCPLKSQTLQCLPSDSSQSKSTNKSSSWPNQYEISNLPISHNEEDLFTFERKEERIPLSRQLWLIGEMPAILYASTDPDKERKCFNQNKLTSFNSTHPKQKSPHERQGNIPSKTSYKTELELPVDVQIILISPFVQSKNTNTEAFIEGNLKSVSNLICAPLDTLCIHEKDVMLQFHLFLKKLVNNAHFHRLRVQHYQCEKALSIISSSAKNSKSKSWNSITTKDYSVTWHLTSTGNVICMLDGVLRSPLFQCLSIINETDLHGNWLPFISESVKLHQVSMFTQVIRQKTKFPWPLQDRDTVLVGCAIDGIQLETPHIIMYGESVPEHATSLFNCPLPLPFKETTRMHIDLFTFILKPHVSNPYVANAKLLVLLDSKLLFVPKTLQSFIARTAATKVFINMQRICASFEQSVYAARVASNKEVYDIIRLRLLNYYSLNSNKL